MRRFSRLVPACVLVALLLGLGALPSTGADLAPLAGKIVCLDPGHGGTDPGAVNATYELHESDINLDVAYGLKELLEGAGAKVEMTRTTAEQYLTNSARYTFCNKARATILVSVHTNSVANPATDGTLALYMKKSDVPLARAVHDADLAALRSTAPAPAAFTDFGLSRFASGVLLKSTMPSTIAEPLFMSNPGEAAWLTQAIYTAPGSGVRATGCESLECRRGQIARAIYSGVLAYFGVPAQ